MGKKLTTAEFIERAQQVHGSRYDYSTTVYTGTMNKVSIGCSVHGIFEQNTMDHMNGRGCSKCNERQPLTVDMFIQRSNEQHQSKYDYSMVCYKNVTTKVTIICPEHGIFGQIPKDHMRGYGCPACGGTKPVTTEEFIQRATAVHGDRYDYSSVKLITMNTDVDVCCNIHGVFAQRPADHLSGVGCPECSLLNRGQYSSQYFDTFPGARDIPAIIYLVTVDRKFCKVGITKRTVSKRFGTGTVSPVYTINTTLYEAYVAEQLVLEKFGPHRFRTQGLRSRGFAGWTECFPISMLEELKREFISMDHQ